MRRIVEIKKRIDNITKGLWHYERGSETVWANFLDKEVDGSHYMIANNIDPEDADFLVNAKSDIFYLFKRLELSQDLCNQIGITYKELFIESEKRKQALDRCLAEIERATDKDFVAHCKEKVDKILNNDLEIVI